VCSRTHVGGHLHFSSCCSQSLQHPKRTISKLVLNFVKQTMHPVSPSDVESRHGLGLGLNTLRQSCTNACSLVHELDAPSGHVNRGVDVSVVGHTAAHQISPSVFDRDVTTVDDISKVQPTDWHARSAQPRSASEQQLQHTRTGIGGRAHRKVWSGPCPRLTRRPR